ncbi:hypothetical protein [Streptomyces ureilyticus]|uniref:Uncharacterized protein n=1 Tax=Streptomyces ureilyticus TaxID=1775131 RepID=A0ABX0E486_9ACTN|nr:hypothetical protein [Streptomyces ureilyticus]NGO49015.1 hypothetical protein [Streptomyces ureilyticus]
MDITAPVAASAPEKAGIPTRFIGIPGPQTTVPSINPLRVVRDTGGAAGREGGMKLIDGLKMLGTT